MGGHWMFPRDSQGLHSWGLLPRVDPSLGLEGSGPEGPSRALVDLSKMSWPKRWRHQQPKVEAPPVHGGMDKPNVVYTHREYKSALNRKAILTPAAARLNQGGILRTLC